MDSIREWIHGIMEWMTHFAYTPYGTWALFGLSFAESSFFPIPPDILLMAMAALYPEMALWFATVTVVASVLGGMFGYFLGHKWGRPVLYKIANEDKVRVVENYYQRYDVWAVGIAGLTPIPYKVFTIAGGVFSLNFPRFVLASVLSRGLRFYAEGLLFFFFGATIQLFLKSYFDWILVGFTVLLVGGFWFLKIMSQRAGSAPEIPDLEEDDK